MIVVPSIIVWLIALLPVLALNTLVVAAAFWLQKEPLEENRYEIGEFWINSATAAGGLTILTPLFWVPAAYGLTGVFGFALAAFAIFPAGCLWIMWVFALDDFAEASMVMMLYLGIPMLLAVVLYVTNSAQVLD